MVIYEDGEPVVDGEAGGDVKVWWYSLKLLKMTIDLFEFNFLFLFSIHRLDWLFVYVQFHIHTAPHDRFRREGNDLRATLTITLVVFFSIIFNHFFSFQFFCCFFFQHITYFLMSMYKFLNLRRNSSPAYLGSGTCSFRENHQTPWWTFGGH